MEIKYLKVNDNANTSYQNLGHAIKVVLRRTLIAIKAYMKMKKVEKLMN